MLLSRRMLLTVAIGAFLTSANSGLGLAEGATRKQWQENQLKRLRYRDGMSEKDALSRIKAQLPQTEKTKRADFVIDNNGYMEETRRQVQELYRELGSLARAKK